MNKNKFFKNNILGVVKRNPLFLHEIEWKNNGFLFTTPNIQTDMSTYILVLTRLLLLFYVCSYNFPILISLKI